MYQINSKCTYWYIRSNLSRCKFHSGNQKKNRKVCQNQRCCVTPYIVIYSVLAMNIEISLRYLKHAAGILYFHPKQPESSSCAGIPAGTSILSGWWNMSTQWKTGSGSFSGLSVESAQFILDIGKFCNWISFFLAYLFLAFWVQNIGYLTTTELSNKTSNNWLNGIAPCACKAVNRCQRKRALALTARKFVRLVFRLLKDNRLYCPAK